MFYDNEINGLTKTKILILCTREGLKLMSESEHDAKPTGTTVLVI